LKISHQEKQPIFLFWERFQRRKDLIFLFDFLALSTVVLLIAFTNIASLISFILFLSATIVVYRLIFDKNIKPIARLFVFYSLIAIGLYLLSYAAYPAYKGFSNATDDLLFFQGAVGSNPVGFQFWENAEEIPFSKLLRIIAIILPVKNVHLIDLLFFNIFGMSFIPVFTSLVAYLLTKEKKVEKLAYQFSMICPVMMANGLILIRDGWTAVLFIGAIYFFLSNRYILLLVTAALLFYIRMASGLQLIVALTLFFYYKFSLSRSNYLKKIILYMTSLVVVISIAIIIYPFLMEYMLEKNIFSNLFFREAYLDFMVQGMEATGESSLFYTINTQPFYLRIPLGFTFFLCAPYLTIKHWSPSGAIVPVQIFGEAFAILFLFYFKYMVQAVLYLWKNKERGMILLAVTFFFLILIASQLSLQFRHKVMLMPFFYILVAYGYYHKTKVGESMGIWGSCCLVLLQLGSNLSFILNS
jgi:hypothetical protein